MRTRLVWIVAALVLPTAACGSDSETDATSTSSTAAAGTSGDPTSTTGAAVGGGQDASKIVLRASDFPSGWTSTPADADESGVDTGDEEIEKCLGVPISDDEGSVESDFEKDQSQVSSSADLVANPDILEADWKAIQGEKFLGCTRQVLEKELARQEGVIFEDTRVADLPYPTLGDGTRAVRVTTTAVAEGQRIPAYFDVVLIRKGLAELSLTFVSLGREFDADLAEDLGRKLVARA